jgi:hypothetical protein
VTWGSPAYTDVGVGITLSVQNRIVMRAYIAFGTGEGSRMNFNAGPLTLISFVANDRSLRSALRSVSNTWAPALLVRLQYLINRPVCTVLVD